MSGDLPFSPLIAEILTAQRTETMAATNAVITNLTRLLETEEARRRAVQEAVLRLLDGPWMPHPRLIESALFPSDETIDAHRPGSSSGGTR